MTPSRSPRAVLVSAAAGGTGSIAGQVARIMGASRVVGIAGSEEKCVAAVEEFGFDSCINYKDGDFSTDYVELGLVQRAVAGGKTGLRQVSFEWHPDGWMVKPLRPIYGPYRIHMQARIAIPKVRLSGVEAMDVALSYIAGPVLEGRRDPLDRVSMITSQRPDLSTWHSSNM